MKSSKKPADKERQAQRFIEAARKAGASEDEREFDEALKRVAKQKPEKDAKR